MSYADLYYFRLTLYENTKMVHEVVYYDLLSYDNLML
jgi:hypothetical protein